MTSNTFEFVIRNKLRFPSSKGELSFEQLWDVPLRSNDNFNLNSVAVAADKALKDVSENFVDNSKSVAVAVRQAVFETVKYVIDRKLEEEDASKKRASNKLEEQKLMKVLAERQDEKLSELSETQIKNRLAALREKQG